MTAPSRLCPRCRKPVPAGATRCPQCNSDLTIVTMPIESLPPDTGTPEEETSLAAIEPASAEILPPADEPAVTRGGWSRSYSLTTSLSTTSGAGARHMNADVKIDLPQEQVDPEKRLSPVAYRRLMVNWSEAIEREVEAASEAGQQPDMRAALQRVPLPFGPDCGGELPISIRDQMNQRAQQQAAQLFSLPTPAEVFGPHAGPGPAFPVRELLERAERSGQPRRRGFTITCGSLVGLLLLGWALGVALTWWALAG